MKRNNIQNIKCSCFSKLYGARYTQGGVHCVGTVYNKLPIQPVLALINVKPFEPYTVFTGCMVTHTTHPLKSNANVPVFIRLMT